MHLSRNMGCEYYSCRKIPSIIIFYDLFLQHFITQPTLFMYPLQCDLVRKNMIIHIQNIHVLALACKKECASTPIFALAFELHRNFHRMPTLRWLERLMVYHFFLLQYHNTIELVSYNKYKLFNSM